MDFEWINGEFLDQTTFMQAHAFGKVVIVFQCVIVGGGFKAYFVF